MGWLALSTPAWQALPGLAQEPMRPFITAEPAGGEYTGLGCCESYESAMLIVPDNSALDNLCATVDKDDDFAFRMKKCKGICEVDQNVFFQGGRANASFPSEIRVRNLGLCLSYNTQTLDVYFTECMDYHDSQKDRQLWYFDDSNIPANIRNKASEKCLLANLFGKHNIHMSDCHQGTHEQARMPPEPRAINAQLSTERHVCVASRSSSLRTALNQRPTVRGSSPSHRTHHRRATRRVLPRHLIRLVLRRLRILPTPLRLLLALQAFHLR